MKLLTTTIGAYPKPDYVTLPDWFGADAGPDPERPTEEWAEALARAGHRVGVVTPLYAGIRERFPSLRIVFEHITTADAAALIGRHDDKPAQPRPF